MRKPQAICQPTLDDPLRQLYWESAQTRHALADKRLTQRFGSAADLEAVHGFMTNIWLDHPLAAQYTMVEPPYYMELALRYGFSLLIEDDQGQLVAAQIAELYGDRDRTLQAFRYAVAPAWRGSGLGRLLVREHAAQAWEHHGAGVRRGMVETTNRPSLVTLLNQVGCVADGYSRHHSPLHLTVTLPLEPAALVGQRVDEAAAVEWLTSLEATTHMLLPAKNEERIKAFLDQGWAIIAVLPTGDLLAVPWELSRPVWTPYEAVTKA